MEAPRAIQTFSESGLRAAAASGRDVVPDHIRSDTLLFGRWGQVGTLRKLDGLSCCVEAPRLGLAVRGHSK